jgi:HPt (histidine-containing phosphotransfer) domain-containing protein
MNTHTTPPSSFLDLSGAKEFAMDDVQMRELMATFLESLTQEIATIQTGLGQNEAVKVEHSLHALKGFMPLFAHPMLAQAVTELYQNSRNQPLDTTRGIFESILPHLEALLAEVRAWSSRL